MALAKMPDAYLHLGKYEAVLFLLDSLRVSLTDAQTAYMQFRALIRLSKEELDKKLDFYSKLEIKKIESRF